MSSVRACLLYIVGVVVLASSALAESPASGPPPMMIDIEQSLVCQCGCGLTVQACDHLNCPSAIPIKKEISKRLERGETKDDILAYFRGRYGEKVLSAPTLSGFNLVAWITPFFALVVGAGVAARAARRWVRETTRETVPSPGQDQADTEVDAKYRERLAREIEEFDD